MGEILQEAYALDQTPPVQALSLAEGAGENPKVRPNVECIFESV